MAELEEAEVTQRSDRRAPAIAAPNRLQGPVGIRRGKQVKNKASDQSLIISLLNKIPVASGGTLGSDGPFLFKAPRDGFCDSELAAKILVFQRHFGGLAHDGVVDPGGRTFTAMQSVAALSAPVGGRKFGRDLAAIDVPLASRKVDRALAKLRDFRTILVIRQTPGGGVAPFDRVTSEALQLQFRLGPVDQPSIAPRRPVTLADVDHIISHFDRMKVVFTRQSTAFSDGSPKDKNGETVPAASPMNSGTVIFSSLYRNFNATDGEAIGPNSRAAILIHEGFHSVDESKTSGDDDVHISEFLPAYDAQPADKSLFNPSSFAGFAAHVFAGADPNPRFGLGPGRFR
jgi:hypothetical protein